MDLEGYESVFTDWTQKLDKASGGINQYISNLNHKPHKGFVDRLKMVGSTAGRVIVDLAAGATKLADLSTDVSLAMNPVTQNTPEGDVARIKVKDTTRAIKLTAKKGYEYTRTTIEDPAARETAMQNLMDYNHKVFIEGDLEAGSDFVSKAFDLILLAAPLKAAQASKLSAAEKAASFEKHANRFIKNGIANESSGFAKASRKWTATEFYKETGWSPSKIDDHLRGIDFKKPVNVVELSGGTDLIQYQVPGGPTGNYFALPGTPANSLGCVLNHAIHITVETRVSIAA